MTKVTDRYDDKNLINLAKQQYDKKQKSKLPSDIVKLPSAGKIYPEDSLLRQGSVEMRHMTAYDEDILTNRSYINEGVVLDKLLDSLITSDIDINELAVFDKEALIVNARISAYGSKYPIVVIDPKTKNKIDRSIDLNDLKFKSVDLDTNEDGECIYHCEDGSIIHYSYAPKKQNIEITESNRISSFLLTLIREINKKRNVEDIKKYIQYDFTFQESKKFQKYVLDNMPGLVTEIEVEGDDGGTFTAGFQFGPDLFWPNL